MEKIAISIFIVLSTLTMSALGSILDSVTVVQDVPQFCKVVTAENFNSNVKNTLIKFIASDFALSPDEKVRRQAIDVAFKWDIVSRKPTLPVSTYQYLPDYVNYLNLHKADNITYPKNLTVAFANRLAEIQSRSDVTQLAGKGSVLLCGITNWKCQKAVQRTATFMSPVSIDDGAIGTVSLESTVSEVGTDSTYLRASRSILSIILEKILQSDQGIVPKGNLFEDVKTIFKEIVGENKALEMSLKFLAVYAVKGADAWTLIDLANDSNREVFKNLQLLGASLSYLDSISQGQLGHPYSLPTEIESHCDYTRPYHFWLSAFLSFKLIQEGFKSETILSAMNALEIGYELSGGAIKRTDLSVFSNEGFRLETMKNLVFNSLGARWITKHFFNNSEYLSIDDELFKFIQRAKRFERGHTGFAKQKDQVINDLAERFANQKLPYYFQWKGWVGLP